METPPPSHVVLLVTLGCCGEELVVGSCYLSVCLSLDITRALSRAPPCCRVTQLAVCGEPLYAVRPMYSLPRDAVRDLPCHGCHPGLCSRCWWNVLCSAECSAHANGNHVGESMPVHVYHNSPPETPVQIKIIVSTGQVLAAASSSFSVPWPAAFATILDSMKVCAASRMSQMFPNSLPRAASSDLHA